MYFFWGTVYSYPGCRWIPKILDVLTSVLLFSGNQHIVQRPQGCSSAAIRPSGKKTRPLSRVWSGHADSAHPGIYSVCSLVRLYMVQHWLGGAPEWRGVWLAAWSCQAYEGNFHYLSIFLLALNNIMMKWVITDNDELGYPTQWQAEIAHAMMNWDIPCNDELRYPIQ